MWFDCFDKSDVLDIGKGNITFSEFRNNNFINYILNIAIQYYLSNDNYFVCKLKV